MMDKVMDGKSVVYALVDPTDDLIRYVGTTQNLSVRMNVHISEARRGCGSNEKRLKWIKKLLIDELRPRVLILDIVDNAERLLVEEQWVWYLREELGFPLVNIALGWYDDDGRQDDKQQLGRKRRWYNGVMRMYNVYLPLRQLDELKKLSEKLGLPVAELIRRAIDILLREYNVCAAEKEKGEGDQAV